MNSTPGSCTRCSKVWQMSSKAWAKSTSVGAMAIGRESMSEASRMSLMRRNSMSQLLRMMRMNSCFSALSLTIGNRSEKPTMAFSGVRISCVILARKAALRRPESSARAVSARSFSCASMRLVMLRESPKYSVSCPFWSKMGMPETVYHVGSLSSGVWSKGRMT